LSLFAVILSCGQSLSTFDASIATQTFPYINRVDPATGKAGDTITIYGFGFSVAAPNNVVSLGGSSTVAGAYTLLATPAAGEIESLTVTIPSGVTVGDTFVFITTFGNTSNANVTFTVTN
jgi:hypothetical protein